MSDSTRLIQNQTYHCLPRKLLPPGDTHQCATEMWPVSCAFDMLFIGQQSLLIFYHALITLRRRHPPSHQCVSISDYPRFRAHETLDSKDVS